MWMSSSGAVVLLLDRAKGSRVCLERMQMSHGGLSLIRLKAAGGTSMPHTSLGSLAMLSGLRCPTRRCHRLKSFMALPLLLMGSRALSEPRSLSGWGSEAPKLAAAGSEVGAQSDSAWRPALTAVACSTRMLTSGYTTAVAMSSPPRLRVIVGWLPLLLLVKVTPLRMSVAMLTTL